MNSVVCLDQRRKLAKHSQEIANHEAIYVLFQTYLRTKPELINLHASALEDKIATRDYMEYMCVEMGALYTKLTREINEELSREPNIS